MVSRLTHEGGVFEPEGGVFERPKRNSLPPRRTPVNPNGDEAHTSQPKWGRSTPTSEEAQSGKGPTGKGTMGNGAAEAFKFPMVDILE